MITKTQLENYIHSEMEKHGYCMKCDECVDLKRDMNRYMSRFDRFSQFELLLESILRCRYEKTCLKLN
ncbi:hypothetical protein UFOVP1361_46 [uncultured Caudovirales phage]|uniref:Uncharacterized protein n=1 Tax=uncultured Caudovirales phage TaxID=2100421 RepID=A0A6J5S2W7_9CAUD|nr:hypothetical protein UFOVP1361_46 [uncultured Caudovirales phage]